MATNHTPALRLNLPLFDQDPWDVDLNTNFSIIDGAIAQFFAIPNFAGVWKNATQFLQGQVVFDASDSSQWQCLVTNTSAATGTFAQDRAARPTLWGILVSSAQSFAQAAATSATQAAASATAAATSATNAANSAATAANKVPLAGGTMTGLLVLSGDPVNVLGAATKQYVDARVGGVGFLPLTGGTLTGPLNLPAAQPTVATQAAHKSYVDTRDALLLPLTGGTLTGALTLSGNPTLANHAANKSYVDSTVAGGAFLKLTGGTLSGPLTVNGTIQSNSGRVISSVSSTTVSPSLTMWDVDANIATGFWCPGTSAIFMGNMDGTGLPTTFWHQFNPSGLFLLNDSSFAMFQTIGPTVITRSQQFANGWLWQWEGNGGNLTWFGPVGAGGAVAGWFQYRTSDRASINFAGPVFATNFASDARFKTNVTPMAYDITTLMALNVVEFDWINPDGSAGAHDCGFIASEVQAVYSEPIMRMGIPAPDGTGGIDDVNPTLGLRDGSMIALVIKCMQEIQTRLLAHGIT